MHKSSKELGLSSAVSIVLNDGSFVTLVWIIKFTLIRETPLRSWNLVFCDVDVGG